MGTAQRQGDLWGHAPEGWATIQEPLHLPLWEAMVDAAGVGPGRHILDAGCGGGGLSAVAIARGARASGIDAAEGLLALAKRRVPDADFRVGDIERLPFADDAFDAVIAANSLQFPADRVATLRGFARVCRPGGRIVAGLFGAPERVAYRAVLEAVRATLPDPPTGPGPFELSSPGVLAALFESAGLEVVERGEVDCPFHYRDAGTFVRAILSAGPVQGAIRVVGESRVRAALLEAAEPFRQRSGAIAIGPNAFTYVAATA